MVREKPADQRCQNKLENGEQCCRKIDGGGAWLYCSECREAAQKQAKRERDRDFSAKRRGEKDDREKDNFYHFLYYHRLTEKQLEPLFKSAETLREEYSCQDDFNKDAFDDINDIMWRLLYPPDDISSTAIATKQQTLHLLNKLKRQQEVSPNRMTDRLIVYAEELRRDSGKRISLQAFTEISGKAKEVLELWRKQKEISGFIYALLVYVELNRLKFLVMPYNNRRFLNKARRWLAAATDVCDRALNQYTGTQKQMVSFLAFYVPLLEGVLAFNGGEPEQAETSLPSLYRITSTIADSYGTTPGTETTRFAYLIHQSQFYMRFNKIDSAYQYLDEAEQILSDLKRASIASIESQLEVAYVKAGLGLASNDQNRHKNLQDYISLFQDYPFLTNYNRLQELERLYRKDVDPSLFKGVPIYFDTMFRRVHPFLVRV